MLAYVKGQLTVKLLNADNTDNVESNELVNKQIKKVNL